MQLAIRQSLLLAASWFEALPKGAVDDLMENPYGRDYMGDLTDWIGRLRGKEPPAPSPQRRAVAELRRDRVKFVSQVGSSGIVEIQAEASRPQIALDIANTYIEVLLARTRSFNVDDAKSTREYLSQQTTPCPTRSSGARRPALVHDGRARGADPGQEARRPPSVCSQLETHAPEVQTNRNIRQTRRAR